MNEFTAANKPEEKQNEQPKPYSGWECGSQTKVEKINFHKSAKQRNNKRGHRS